MLKTDCKSTHQGLVHMHTWLNNTAIRTYSEKLWQFVELLELYAPDLGVREVNVGTKLK